MLRKHPILFAAMVIVIFCPIQLLLAAADLNQAVEELAGNLNAAGQGRVVIAPFTYNQTLTQFSVTLQEKLVTTMVKKGLKVVERNQLEQVLREQKLTYSGLFNLTSAKSVGKLLGAEEMVLGTIQDQGNTVEVNARLVDLETAGILKATEVTLPKTPVITKELAQTLSSSPGGTDETGNVVQVPSNNKPIQTVTVYGINFELQTCSKSEGMVTCQFRVSFGKDTDLIYEGGSMFDEYGEQYNSGANNKWVRLNGKLASKVEATPKVYLVADVPLYLIVNFEGTPSSINKISLLRIHLGGGAGFDMRNIALSR